jgi:hypothetical protein
MGLLLGGIFLSIVKFAFILTFTAAPSAFFIWIINKLHAQYLLAFAFFGAALGWFAQLLFNPLGQQEIFLLFVFAGMAGGVVYWFVTKRRVVPLAL